MPLFGRVSVISVLAAVVIIVSMPYCVDLSNKQQAKECVAGGGKLVGVKHGRDTVILCQMPQFGRG